MNIDYNEWKFWLDLIQLVGTVLLGIYVWFSNRHRVTNKSLVDHNTRLTCLELDIKHMPTQTDIIGLNTRIDLVNGVLQRVEGRLDGINRAVDLMNEHLLNRRNG